MKMNNDEKGSSMSSIIEDPFDLEYYLQLHFLDKSNSGLIA